MKLLIIKKSILYKFIFVSFILLLFFIIFLLSKKNFESFQTFFSNTCDMSQYDFDGDGRHDELQIINGQNKIDFRIKCSNEDYHLSHYTDDKILFTSNYNLEPFLFINDISRDKIPEIILTGSKKNINTSYLFCFSDSKPLIMEIHQKNIVGILNSRNSKTPQLFFLDSKYGISSQQSIMLINNEIIDVSEPSNSIPSLNTIIHFINIIELPYVMDELPDIFTENIASSDLSLLWNLDKDNMSYSFQNAFFYDYAWDNYNNPKNIKCRLSFNKSSLKSENTINEEKIMQINLIKYEQTYKIESINIK